MYIEAAFLRMVDTRNYVEKYYNGNKVYSHSLLYVGKNKFLAAHCLS